MYRLIAIGRPQAGSTPRILVPHPRDGWAHPTVVTLPWDCPGLAPGVALFGADHQLVVAAGSAYHIEGAGAPALELAADWVAPIGPGVPPGLGATVHALVTAVREGPRGLVAQLRVVTPGRGVSSLRALIQPEIGSARFLGRHPAGTRTNLAGQLIESRWTHRATGAARAAFELHVTTWTYAQPPPEEAPDAIV